MAACDPAPVLLVMRGDKISVLIKKKRQPTPVCAKSKSTGKHKSTLFTLLDGRAMWMSVLGLVLAWLSQLKRELLKRYLQYFMISFRFACRRGSRRCR